MRVKLSDEAGFTLLEVLASLGIFAIVVGGIPGLFVSYSKYNTMNQMRSEALVAAQEVLDELRLDDPSLMPMSGAGPTEVLSIGNRDYDVTAHYCLTPSYCSTTNNRHITIRVERNGTVFYEAETVFTKLR